MSNNVYIVMPRNGYGSDDMVIVASSAVEAEKMYFKESGKEGEYYEEERKGGAIVQRIITSMKGVRYTRQDNM